MDTSVKPYEGPLMSSLTNSRPSTRLVSSRKPNVLVSQPDVGLGTLKDILSRPPSPPSSWGDSSPFFRDTRPFTTTIDTRRKTTHELEPPSTRLQPLTQNRTGYAQAPISNTTDTTADKRVPAQSSLSPRLKFASLKSGSLYAPPPSETSPWSPTHSLTQELPPRPHTVDTTAMSWALPPHSAHLTRAGPRTTASRPAPRAAAEDISLSPNVATQSFSSGAAYAAAMDAAERAANPATPRVPALASLPAAEVEHLLARAAPLHLAHMPVPVLAHLRAALHAAHTQSAPAVNVVAESVEEQQRAQVLDVSALGPAQLLRVALGEITSECARGPVPVLQTGPLGDVRVPDTTTAARTSFATGKVNATTTHATSTDALDASANTADIAAAAIATSTTTGATTVEPTGASTSAEAVLARAGTLAAQALQATRPHQPNARQMRARARQAVQSTLRAALDARVDAEANGEKKREEDREREGVRERAAVGDVSLAVAASQQLGRTTSATTPSSPSRSLPTGLPPRCHAPQLAVHRVHPADVLTAWRKLPPGFRVVRAGSGTGGDSHGEARESAAWTAERVREQWMALMRGAEDLEEDVEEDGEGAADDSVTGNSGGSGSGSGSGSGGRSGIAEGAKGAEASATRTHASTAPTSPPHGTPTDAVTDTAGSEPPVTVERIPLAWLQRELEPPPLPASGETRFAARVLRGLLRRYEGDAAAEEEAEVPVKVGEGAWATRRQSVAPTPRGNGSASGSGSGSGSTIELGASSVAPTPRAATATATTTTAPTNSTTSTTASTAASTSASTSVAATGKLRRPPTTAPARQLPRLLTSTRATPTPASAPAPTPAHARPSPSSALPPSRPRSAARASESIQMVPAPLRATVRAPLRRGKTLGKGGITSLVERGAERHLARVGTLTEPARVAVAVPGAAGERNSVWSACGEGLVSIRGVGGERQGSFEVGDTVTCMAVCAGSPHPIARAAAWAAAPSEGEGEEEGASAPPRPSAHTRTPMHASRANHPRGHAHGHKPAATPSSRTPVPPHAPTPTGAAAEDARGEAQVLEQPEASLAVGAGTTPPPVLVWIGTQNGTVSVVDARGMRQVLRAQAHSAAVTAIAASDAGVVTADAEGTLLYWSRDGSRVIRVGSVGARVRAMVWAMCPWPLSAVTDGRQAKAAADAGKTLDKGQAADAATEQSPEASPVLLAAAPQSRMHTSRQSSPHAPPHLQLQRTLSSMHTPADSAASGPPYRPIPQSAERPGFPWAPAPLPPASLAATATAQAEAAVRAQVAQHGVLRARVFADTLHAPSLLYVAAGDGTVSVWDVGAATAYPTLHAHADIAGAADMAATSDAAEAGPATVRTDVDLAALAASEARLRSLDLRSVTVPAAPAPVPLGASPRSPPLSPRLAPALSGASADSFPRMRARSPHGLASGPSSPPSPASSIAGAPSPPLSPSGPRALALVNSASLLASPMASPRKNSPGTHFFPSTSARTDAASPQPSPHALPSAAWTLPWTLPPVNTSPSLRCLASVSLGNAPVTHLLLTGAAVWAATAQGRVAVLSLRPQPRVLQLWALRGRVEALTAVGAEVWVTLSGGEVVVWDRDQWAVRGKLPRKGPVNQALVVETEVVRHVWVCGAQGDGEVWQVAERVGADADVRVEADLVALREYVRALVREGRGGWGSATGGQSLRVLCGLFSEEVDRLVAALAATSAAVEEKDVCATAAVRHAEQWSERALRAEEACARGEETAREREALMRQLAEQVQVLVGQVRSERAQHEREVMLHRQAQTRTHVAAQEAVRVAAAGTAQAMTQQRQMSQLGEQCAALDVAVHVAQQQEAWERAEREKAEVRAAAAEARVRVLEEACVRERRDREQALGDANRAQTCEVGAVRARERVEKLLADERAAREEEERAWAAQRQALEERLRLHEEQRQAADEAQRRELEELRARVAVLETACAEQRASKAESEQACAEAQGVAARMSRALCQARLRVRGAAQVAKGSGAAVIAKELDRVQQDLLLYAAIGSREDRLVAGAPALPSSTPRQ